MEAHRWIRASHALEELPQLSEGLAGGVVSLDKVVELARFATPKTEADLLAWSKRVSYAAVRRRADLEQSSSTRLERDAEQARFLEWWYLDEGRRMGLQAELPAAQGATVVRAIQRMAERLPTMPDEEGPVFAPARRADALFAICSSAVTADPDPDRATVIVHAQVDSLAEGTGGSEVEDGPVLHVQTARRLLCDARIQTVLEDRAGNIVNLGRMRREPSASMVRQIRYRDKECRFPGCGAKRFRQAHHIRWWGRGGSTDLENLLLICSFHHRLVHELGWSVSRDSDGTVKWCRPDGTRYRAGPSPGEAIDRTTFVDRWRDGSRREVLPRPGTLVPA